MDELVFYDGAYTGPQIDAAIAKIYAAPAATYTINGVSFAFRKWGRVVVVTTSGSNTAATSTSQYMGNVSVAQDYYPPAAVISYFVATGAGAAAMFNLTAAGVLYVGNTSSVIPAGTTWRGTIVYISAS